MEQPSYSTVIMTPKSTNEVYMAINNVPGWWTENFEGSSKKIGDEFTVTFSETFIKLKVVEQRTNFKIEWDVIDGHKHFLKDKKEWVGTKICFDIENLDNVETKLTFTHVGLMTPLECYEICRDAWNSYLQGSLKKLINFEMGTPDKKE